LTKVDRDLNYLNKIDVLQIYNLLVKKHIATIA